MGVLVKPPAIISAVKYGAATSDRTAIANTSELAITEASVCWGILLAKITTFTAGRVLFSKNGQDGNGGIQFQLNGTEEILLRVSGSITNAQSISNNIKLKLGQWVWLAFSYDPAAATQSRIFFGSLKDLIREATYASTTTISGVTTSTVDILIGAINPSAPTNALQGDIAFCAYGKNQRLGAADFELIRQQREFNPGRVRSLIWMPLNTASKTLDYSGRMNHGTNSGGTMTAAPVIPVRARRSFKKTVTLFTQSVAGTLTPAAALVKLTARTLTGGITPAATIAAVKTALKSLDGTITPAGALVKQTARALSAAIAPAGALIKLTARSLAGAITPAGSLASLKSALKSLAGALTPAGAIVKQTGKGAAGSTAPSGSIISRACSRALAGVIAPAGSIAKLTARQLTAAIGLAGTVAGLILTGITGLPDLIRAQVHRVSPIKTLHALFIKTIHRGG